MSATTLVIDQQAGPRLRAWLEAQDPPRPAQIARRAGVSRQFVCNVMAGRAKPTVAIVVACAELGLPVEVIFGAGAREVVPQEMREASFRASEREDDRDPQQARRRRRRQQEHPSEGRHAASLPASIERAFELADDTES